MHYKCQNSNIWTNWVFLSLREGGSIPAGLEGVLLLALGALEALVAEDPAISTIQFGSTLFFFAGELTMSFPSSLTSNASWG